MIWLFKSLVFILCMIPAVWLGWAFVNDALGANPFEALTRQAGEWTLRFLLLTLFMTPLRALLQQSWPLKIRRMLGLTVFFYATGHLLTYLWFDQFFDWQEIVRDIAKRPFITAGMAAWLLLLPLALTSNRFSIRRLGKRWKSLHRSVYAIALLGVLHFFWLVKADLREPLIYAGILVLLLGYRLIKHYRVKKAALTTQRQTAI